jgi:hypothetical protein
VYGDLKGGAWEGKRMDKRVFCGFSFCFVGKNSFLGKWEKRGRGDKKIPPEDQMNDSNDITTGVMIGNHHLEEKFIFYHNFLDFFQKNKNTKTQNAGFDQIYYKIAA